MKKLTVLIAFLLISLAAFAEGQQETAKNKPVTLRFSWWGGDSRHQATLDVIALYEQKNPNVKIEAEYGGWDGYYQKLVTQLAGGTAADIMQIDQPWLYELSSRGDVFQTLDTEATMDLSGFDSKFLADYCSFGDSVKGLPTGINGEVLFLDKDVLTKYGISIDTNWDWNTIVSEGAKINKINSNMYMLNLAPDVFTFFLEKYLSQKSGTIIKQDKSLGFTKSDAVDAFTYFQSWIDNKIIPPFSEIVLYNKKGEENPNWLNSQMAAMLTWTSNLDKIRGAKSNTMVTSLPVMKGSKNSGIMVRPSQLIVINGSSKYSVEATKFVNYFFNDPEALTILGTVRGVPPTDKGRSLLKKLNVLDPQVEKGTNVALSVLGKPQTVWQMNAEIKQIMDDVVEQFGFEMITPEEAAEMLITQMKEKLSTL